MAIRPVGGPQSEAKVRIQAGVAANIGDLMVQSGNYAVPFAGPGQTENLHDNFVGVLKAGKQLGTQTADHDALVFTSGDFEGDLDVPATVEVPVATPVSATAVQTVSVVDVVLAEQLGELVRRVNPSDTTCIFRIHPAKFGGGIQTPA